MLLPAKLSDLVAFLENGMRHSILMIGLLLSVSAFADDSGISEEKYFPQKLTAQDLLLHCASSALSASGRNRQNYCSGFVSGVEESIRLLDMRSAGDKQRICVPEGKPASHFRQVYIRHASDRRTNLGRPAALVVLEALQAAYPCAE